MANWKLVFFAILSILCAFLIECSLQDVAGGTDTGNAFVAGIIVDSLGLPMPNTEVSLIPVDYNPAKNSLETIPVAMTGSKGTYRLILSTPEGGVFNINAVHGASGTRFLLQDVSVYDDTTIAKPGILRAPGVIKVVLADSVITENGYVYIPGTDRFERFSPEQILTINGIPYIVFDSLPANVPLEIYYSKENLIQPPLFLQETTVTPADTIDITFTESWEIFTTGNSDLPENSLLSVLVEDNGVVWVGTQSRGLVSYDGSLWTEYHSGNSLLPNDTVRALAQDRNGDIWIGTVNGLARKSGSTWDVFTKDVVNLADNYITDIMVDSLGKTWFSTLKGLTSFDGTTWSSTFIVAGQQLTKVHTIITDNPGNIMIGTDYGLFYYTYGENTWTYIPLMGLIMNVPVLDIAVDADNAFWLTTSGGVVRYYEKQWMVFNSMNINIPTDSMQSVVVDRNDAVWAGAGNAGVVANYEDPVQVYTEANTTALQGAGAIQDIEADDHNTLYFATRNKGLILLKFIFNSK